MEFSFTPSSRLLKIPIHFTRYGDESDPGPYPIPLNAPIEGGNPNKGDRHVLAVDKGANMLYELYIAQRYLSTQALFREGVPGLLLAR